MRNITACNGSEPWDNLVVDAAGNMYRKAARRDTIFEK
jgi:hypothetical protein